MNWTAEQLDIFDWFEDGPGTPNAVVEARAGCGKTSTILEGVSRAPDQRKIVVAFNRHIARELQEKVPDGTQARTLHSLGRGWCVKCYNGIEVDRWLDRKRVKDAWTRLREANPATFPKGNPDLVSKVEKITTLVKGTQPFFSQRAEIDEVMRTFNLGPTLFEREEFEVLPEHLVEVAWLAFVITLEEFSGPISFSDMVWLPLRKGWCQGVFDLICVDEAQDMASSQIELALRSCKPEGRICVIGDSRQSIYAFAGADPHVLRRLSHRLDAEEFSLTTTFRCPQAVVKSVNYLVPDLRAAPDAPEGFVGKVNWTALLENAEPSDFVLSRTNAPLIRVALGLLGKGKKAQIVGADDFGEALKTTFEKIWERMVEQDLDAFYEALEDWEIEEHKQATTDSQRDWINDLGAALAVLAQTAAEGDVAAVAFEIGVRIESVFGKGSPGAIELSTTHKSKGREARTVWLITASFPDRKEPPCLDCRLWEWMHTHEDHRHKTCRNYVPNNEWVEAEENIEYVAVTRSQDKLFWVQGVG